MKDSLLILSGGMDSTTLLYEYQNDIALAVSFDYGSNHNADEIPFAEYHCKKLGIKHTTVRLDFFKQYFRSSLLEGADAIPEGSYADENMKSTVVPFSQWKKALFSDADEFEKRVIFNLFARFLGVVSESCEGFCGIGQQRFLHRFGSKQANNTNRRPR